MPSSGRPWRFRFFRRAREGELPCKGKRDWPGPRLGAPFWRHEIYTGGAGPSRKRFIPPAVPRRRGAGGGTGPPRELLPGRRYIERSGGSVGVFLSRRTADSRARRGKVQPGPPGCGSLPGVSSVPAKLDTPPTEGGPNLPPGPHSDKILAEGELLLLDA